MTIRTPDQRLRVFVSSTLQELAAEREAARRGIGLLRLTPVMFELGARAHAPQDLYRAYVEQSDVFVGVYWQRYGWIAPGMEVSGLEDEFRLASGKPMLIYVKHPAPEREERLQVLLGDIRSNSVACYRSFSSPEELADLVADDLAVLITERFEGVSPKPASVDKPVAGLPATMTSFVGRERELRYITSLLGEDDTRLLTLTGMGGIGKTRLALEVAAIVKDSFEDGVCFVRLEALEDAELVGPAIAEGLGLRPAGPTSALEAVGGHLADKRMLVILDSFERVIGAAPSIAALLARCPRVKVLCTSRQALRVHGEREFQVPPLGVPGDEAPEKLLENDAIKLFVDRATAAWPDFSLTPENAPAVAAVCRELDGLPLAIELAAARVRVMPPEMLMQRLGSRLDALRSTFRDTPERQRTLRSTVTWSYELLGDEERRLFAQLAVFEGSFSLEAVEHVCGADGLDVLDVLGSLLDKSLIAMASEGGEPRFRMFAVVQDLAWERLGEHEGAPVLTSRHADHYRELVVASYLGLRGTQQLDWLARLDRDERNIRKAMRHLIDHRLLEEAAEMLWSLWLFWWMRARIREGRRWTAEILPMTESDGGIARAQVLASEGFLAFSEIDIGAAVPAFVEANQLFRALDHASGSAATMGALAMIQAFADPSEGRSALVEARDRFRQLDEVWGEVITACALGWLDVGLGVFGDRQGYIDALERAESLGDEHLIAMALGNLAEASLSDGEWGAASAYVGRGLTLCHKLRVLDNLTYSLEVAARIAMAYERQEPAVRLFAAVDSMRERIGIPPNPVGVARRDRDLAGIKELIGPPAYEGAWAQGSDLDVDGAVAAALTAIEPDEGVSPRALAPTA